MTEKATQLKVRSKLELCLNSNNAALVRGRRSHNSLVEPIGLTAQHAGLDVALLSKAIFLKVWKKIRECPMLKIHAND